MSNSSSIFTGSSNFSTDFQQVITRAVAIASLPIQQLQTEVTALQSESSSLTALQTKVAGLQSSLTSLESALGTGSFTSSLSNSDVASVGLTGTPMAGTLSVEVTAIGSFSSAMSNDGPGAITDIAKSTLSDAVSYTLRIGEQFFTIVPSAQTLSSLSDAINNQLGAGVQANIVNIGPAASPDFRLSLTGTSYGDFPIQLTADDGAREGETLLTAGDTGAPVRYRVNGKPATEITSESRIISPAPGVSVTLLEEGTTTVTVSRTAAAVSSALANLASSYNGILAELDKNHGEAAGALRGQSILNTVSDALHRISGYSTEGSITSLTQLGLGFDKDGKMSFDSTTFAAAGQNRFAALSEFLGSSRTSGFLKSATDTVNLLNAAETGLFPQRIDMVQGQISRTHTSIESRQDRVDALELRLQAQMAAADAAIAALEQQYSYFSNMITAMQDAQRNN